MTRTLPALLLATATAATSPAAASALDDIDRDISPLRPMVIRKAISLEHSAELPTTQMFAPGGDPLPIYLNRWGDTYYGGNDNSATNHSSIVGGGANVLSPFGGTDAQWDTVKGCVQDMFSRFNVYVTDVEPLDGDYVECAVGGRPGEVGMSGGVAGVAPYDPNCGAMTNAIVFAFSEVYPRNDDGLQRLCETITQEVAHAFSLDHELMCEDPMTYLEGCGAKEFQDVYAPCGEFSERECMCGDPNTQNSVQMLWEILGPGEGITPPPPPDDREPPTLAIVSPDDGVTAQANSTVDIVATATDDIGLVTVTLEWHHTGDGLPCPGEGRGWSCFVEGDTYTWTVEVTEGLREYSVRARDVMGKVAETETRWVWFSNDLTEERPVDEVPPELTLVWPPADAYIPLEQERLQFIVTAYDADTSVLDVGLVRSYGGGSFVIPCIEDDGSHEEEQGWWPTCTRLGGTYIFEMGNRREGTRGWAAVATDQLGNEVISDARYYHVVAGADPRPANDRFEPNDTWDFANTLACGTSVDLKVDTADIDWFEVPAPVGMRVKIDVTGDITDRLRLAVQSGPLIGDIMEHKQAKQGADVIVPEGGLRFRTYSDGTVAGDYNVTVTCQPQDLPVPDAAPRLLGVCSHVDVSAGPGAVFGLLALFGLAFAGRRRRR
jgi:MYXO-CTERM domain-containing protein